MIPGCTCGKSYCVVHKTGALNEPPECEICDEFPALYTVQYGNVRVGRACERCSGEIMAGAEEGAQRALEKLKGKVAR